MASFDLEANTEENCFFPILDIFLSRQLHLDGNIGTISHLVVKSKIFFESSLIHVFRDQAREHLIGYNDNYAFSTKEGEKRLQLNSYLLLNLLAQSVENFETYLKKIIGKIIELEFQNEALPKQLNKFRSNKERVNFLKTLFNVDKEDKQFADLEKLYFWLEEIRHKTVHSDQRVNQDDEIVRHKLFSDYFTLEKYPGIHRLSINSHNAQTLNKCISELAYNIYYKLSSHYSFPIKLTNPHPF